MSYLRGFNARQRRNLIRLRMQVEAGYLCEFDEWDQEGVWFCRWPLPPHVGPPTPRLEVHP